MKMKLILSALTVIVSLFLFCGFRADFGRPHITKVWRSAEHGGREYAVRIQKDPWPFFGESEVYALNRWESVDGTSVREDVLTLVDPDKYDVELTCLEDSSGTCGCRVDRDAPGPDPSRELIPLRDEARKRFNVRGLVGEQVLEIR